MDPASMIMGAAIASIAWIAFIPSIRRSGAQARGAESPSRDTPPKEAP